MGAIPLAATAASAVAAPKARASSPSIGGEDALTLDPLHEAVPFPLGTCVEHQDMIGVPGKVLSRHFSQMTGENYTKPYAWYNDAKQFVGSAGATEIMDYAQAHGMRVYGHVLVWHAQTPAWFFQNDDGAPLTNSPADQEILRGRMRTHIFSVARYLAMGWGPFGSDTNPLVAWEVVNEVIDNGTSHADGMRRSDWYRVLGEEFVDLAFEYADRAFNKVYADRSADRPVTLFINDYGTENAGKRARYLALVERLRGRGAPLDAVGHQFHVNLTTPIAALDAALDDVAALGLEQAVTELDVPTGVPVTQPRLVEQGYFYRDAFRVFREHADSLFSVSFWGMNDGGSWRRESGAPLLFTDEFTAKYAFWGVVDVELPPRPPS
ncbi:endo-1,4-beta-xylanase [Actinopolymorpha sp. B11F2]|uniref:endo-1,4-beta-xylanase n=1 Tax=Actinopolymorpha sp. B11F2 TaxID=3160862 RepID=UPI0032E46A67